MPFIFILALAFSCASTPEILTGTNVQRSEVNREEEAAGPPGHSEDGVQARTPTVTRKWYDDDTSNLQVGVYKTLELVFLASISPSNPFDTYLLKLEVTDPNGLTSTIDGYYDGNGNGGQNGRVWKARITPYITGTWSWKTIPGDITDPQLLGLSGQFESIASQEVGGVTADGQHFRLQNGDYVFLVGNFLDLDSNNTPKLVTTHVFMGENTSNDRRDLIIERQRDLHDANKANVYFANKGDYGGETVTPWLGTKNNNDKTKMDLARWALYDGYILRLKEEGMWAEMWFFADDSGFGNLTAAERNRLFRYAMARTSAFNHAMYVIALEWQEGFSHREITASGNYLQSKNPWGRMLSVHSTELSNWDFSGESWATFIASQGGNNAQHDTVNAYAISMRNNESIPHIDEEFGVLNGDIDEGLRRNLWANFCGGAAGSGTGSDLKAFQGFLSQSQVPFQRMKPANSLVEGGGNSRFVLAEAGHHYVVCSTGGAFTLDVSGTGLNGRWYDPRDPNATLGAPFSVTAGTQTYTPPNNVNEDWVLWISDGSQLNSATSHPASDTTIVSVLVNPVQYDSFTYLPALSGG